MGRVIAPLTKTPGLETLKVMRVRIRFAMMGACLAVASQLLQPIPAHAIHRDVRTVLVASAYGLVGGTLVGAITYPFNQSVRSIFIGSSIGLYLGIVVGVYVILNRDDPGNPLRSQYQIGPSAQLWSLGERTDLLQSVDKSPGFELTWPVARF